MLWLPSGPGLLSCGSIIIPSPLCPQHARRPSVLALASMYTTRLYSSGGGGGGGGKPGRRPGLGGRGLYDTFFTMKRLIERSRRGDEVLRWVTQNHYPIALQKIGQLLQNEGRQILEHQDFQTLCNAIVSDCVKFDNFSIVNCLYAVAALGLPSDSQVVQVLEAESQSRLDQFNQKDVSMVFSSSMKLHPSSQHPLTEACLAGLEKNLERDTKTNDLMIVSSQQNLILGNVMIMAFLFSPQVIQKLVFPFSRMNYLPSNKVQFFSKLEVVLELKALSSPLATVNILMSLFQLGHFPGLVLHRVFSTAFISNITNSPYALIVLRYLSLLDAAVELEYQDYTCPQLQDTHKVLMFDHALTADEVNRKYSYKGLVAEALRQLVGEHGYKQDEVPAPGYYTGTLNKHQIVVVMSVNDTWHYCHNSEVLVGSRAMRDRHLLLLGYVILQVSQYHLNHLKNHIFLQTLAVEWPY
uniref:Fas-activated serine/threonine kinase n=1 Tax=Hucho hucho TaxID=62062 RepID=A0A4W5RQJ7_9TELE